MAETSSNELAQDVAQAFGAIVWEGIPQGGLWTQWRNDDVQEYIATLAPLRPPVVYVDPDDGAIAVAVAGVLHVFGGDLRSLDLDYQLSVDDEPWDVRLLPKSAEHLRDVARSVSNDPRFDAHDELVVDQLIEEAGIDPASDDFETVRSEAKSAFYDGPERVLQREARKLARRLLEHADFDPLLVAWNGVDQDDLYREVLGVQEPRLERRVSSAVWQAVNQKGLRDKAESELKATIKALMTSIPRLVLDQVGFSSRNVAREAALEPYLSSVPKRRWPLAAYWVNRFEEEESRTSRENRYAYAASELVERGMSKKAVATTLRLSPSALERILTRSIPADFQLDPADPILLELAPELRDQLGGS